MRRYVSELAWIGDEWSPYMERWIMLRMMVMIMIMVLMMLMMMLMVTMQRESQCCAITYQALPKKKTSSNF